jgi:charged multivesicular body protein 7
MYRFIAVFALCGLAQGFFFGSSGKWDGLRVTFNPKIWDKYAFAKLPRTVDDAVAAKWTLKDSQCTSSSQNFRGRRYWLDNDPASILLFDKNGYIAGIQTSVPSAGYTPTPMNKGSSFQQDGDFWTLTVYFVDPSIICSTGRTADQFNADGTGTDLYIQNGTNPETMSIQIPTSEDDIKTTKWGSGKCLPTMGKHYWFNVFDDMNCDNFFPYCLLYNGGKLNAFCFAIDHDFETSKRYEHPSTSEAGMCCLHTPQCMKNDPKYKNPQTTMHVYTTDSPYTNFC